MSGPETSLIFVLLSGNTNKKKRDIDWEYPTILEGLSLYTRGGGVTGSVYVCTNEVWWKCLFTSNVLEKTYHSNYLEGLNSVGQSSANGQGRGTATSYVAKQRNRSITPLPPRAHTSYIRQLDKNTVSVSQEITRIRALSCES